MSAALRLVVFDVDGTLVDSQNHIMEAMTEAFGATGRAAPSRADVLGIVGLSLQEALARLLPDDPEATVTRAVEAYKAAYLRQRAARGPQGAAPLFPGVRAALETLAAQEGVLLGAATGMARRGLDHVFAAHALDDLFTTRQTADMHPSKPHPAMLEAALSETGVAAGNAVILGDTSYDMEMGRAAGVTAIGVGWGYHAPAALKRAGARCVLDRCDQIVGAVDALWGEQE